MVSLGLYTLVTPEEFLLQFFSLLLSFLLISGTNANALKTFIAQKLNAIPDNKG